MFVSYLVKVPVSAMCCAGCGCKCFDSQLKQEFTPVHQLGLASYAKRPSPEPSRPQQELGYCRCHAPAATRAALPCSTCIEPGARAMTWCRAHCADGIVSARPPSRYRAGSCPGHGTTVRPGHMSGERELAGRQGGNTTLDRSCVVGGPQQRYVCTDFRGYRSSLRV